MKRHSLLIAIVLFVVSIYVGSDTSSSHEADSELEKVDQQLNLVVKEFRQYAKKTGKYPTNDEALLPLVSNEFASKEFKEFYSTEKLAGEAWRDRFHARCRAILIDKKSSTIVDCLGNAILYENRSGLPIDSFRCSPLLEKETASWFGAKADLVDNTHWWKEVSPNVFIYSLSGRRLAANIAIRDSKNFCSAVIFYFSALFFLFAISLLVSKDVETRTNQLLKFVVSFFMGFGVLFIGIVSQPSCYARTPAVDGGNLVGLRKEQAQLLDDFVDNGVINPETAKRLKEANLQRIKRRRR